MARAEQVTYQCDVCGKTEEALKVQSGGQPFYVRPLGWGVASVLVQDTHPEDGERIKEKWDFCREECAQKRWNDLMDDAYR